MEYNLKELQSVCDVRSSKRIYAKELCSSGVPFFRSKEIIEKLNGAKNHTNPLFISEEKYQDIVSKFGSLSSGDLLLTSRGTLGVPYIVAPDDRFHFADGNLTWFRNFNGLSSNYLKYYFLSPAGKGELSRCVIGSSQLAYTIASLKKISIPLPKIEYQKKVVDMLSRYDNLIENNNRRIAILEDMAQSLYREWFVNFRYPNHEDNLDVDGKPKLIDSSLGQIPEGWEIKKVKDIIGRVKAGVVYKKNDVLDEGNIQVIDQSRAEILGYHNDAADHHPTATNPIPIFGDHTCKMKLMVEPFSIGPNVVVFEPKIDSQVSYIFQLIRSLISTQEYKRHWSDLNSKEVVLAPSRLTNDYSDKIRPILSQISVLSKSNVKLSKARDLLLPKLISGQIEL